MSSSVNRLDNQQINYYNQQVENIIKIYSEAEFKGSADTSHTLRAIFHLKIAGVVRAHFNDNKDQLDIKYQGMWSQLISPDSPIVQKIHQAAYQSGVSLPDNSTSDNEPQGKRQKIGTPSASQKPDGASSHAPADVSMVINGVRVTTEGYTNTELRQLILNFMDHHKNNRSQEGHQIISKVFAGLNQKPGNTPEWQRALMMMLACNRKRQIYPAQQVIQATQSPQIMTTPLQGRANAPTVVQKSNEVLSEDQKDVSVVKHGITLTTKGYTDIELKQLILNFIKEAQKDQLNSCTDISNQIAVKVKNQNLGKNNREWLRAAVMIFCWLSKMAAPNKGAVGKEMPFPSKPPLTQGLEPSKIPPINTTINVNTGKTIKNYSNSPEVNQIISNFMEKMESGEIEACHEILRFIDRKIAEEPNAEWTRAKTLIAIQLNGKTS